MYAGILEANGEEVGEWLRSPGFEVKLFSFFPCTDILPSVANKVSPAIRYARLPFLVSACFSLSYLSSLIKFSARAIARASFSPCISEGNWLLETEIGQINLLQEGMFSAKPCLMFSPKQSHP